MFKLMNLTDRHNIFCGFKGNDRKEFVRLTMNLGLYVLLFKNQISARQVLKKLSILKYVLV